MCALFSFFLCLKFVKPVCHMFADGAQIAAYQNFVFTSQKQKQVSFFLWYASLLQKHASPCRAWKLIGIMSQGYIAEVSHSCQLLNMCFTDELLALLVHCSMKTFLVCIQDDHVTHLWFCRL